MMKILKKIFLLAAFILCIAAPSSKTYAEGEYEYLILDNENLLTDGEESELASHMKALLPYGNVIFQTIRLSSASYESYSENTYYEYFKNEPGVIFQIDMGNRKLTISTSTGLDDIVAPERDSIVDNVYRYASEENYLACADECFDEIYAVLNDGTIAHNMKYIDNAILAVIISLIVNYLFVFASHKDKPAEEVLMSTSIVTSDITKINVKKGKLQKIYSPPSSSSGGGGGSSGGGGGGGGGGFSGGSSSHGF